MKKIIITVTFLAGCLYANAQVGIGTNTPTSTLDVNGSLSTKITEVTDPNAYSIDITHQTVVFRGSGGSISMPLASTCTGREYTLVNFSSGSVIANTNFDAGTGIINFVPTMTVFKVKSNGTAWIQVDKTSTPTAADGSETKVNAGTGVTVTGTGTSASPYVVNSSITQADGSETRVNAGTGVTVTGTGTSVSPYIVNSTIAQADGSETRVNAGTGVTVTGTGTSASPYIVNSSITQADGAETKVNVGTGLTKSGSGTTATPYNVDLNPKVKFIYMPSVSINTSSTGAGRTLDLYTTYKNQFNTPQVASASAPASIAFFPAATDLYYYVTYYDTNVFNNVSINASGVLTYDVIGTATDCTYMNIVFVVK